VGDGPKNLRRLGSPLEAAVAAASSLFFTGGPLCPGAKSAIHQAMAGDSPEAIEELARSMPDFPAVLNPPPVEGELSPLFLAAQGGQFEFVEQLIRLGADCAALNDEGQNIILFTVGSLSTSQLRKLFALLPAAVRDAAINAVSPDLHSPLMAACCRGDDTIIKLLLEFGAKVTTERDTDGDNLAHKVVKTSKVGLLKQILELDPSPTRRGAVTLVTAENNSGLTVVDISIDNMLDTISTKQQQHNYHGYKKPRRQRALGAAAAAAKDEEEEEPEEPDVTACLLTVRAAAEGKKRQLVTFDDVQKAVTRELKQVVPGEEDEDEKGDGDGKKAFAPEIHLTDKTAFM